MIFERFECDPGNSTVMIIKKCWMRRAGRIGSDRNNVYMEADIFKPLMGLYSHNVVYYKYGIYKKFPVDFWEDVCSWLNGKKKSFMMDWTLGRALKYVSYDRNLTCPLEGNLTVSFNNISLNKQFPMVPLLPSGHYRIETSLTEANRNIVIANTRFFIAISDTRIEQY